MTASAQRDKIYGLLAEFADPRSLLHAVSSARVAGYTHLEAFSPYPIEGLYQALRLKHDRVALITLVGGVVSGALGYFMQWYANVVDYPLDIGGRPNNSWPAFIPITFELTVLGAALSAAIGMLALNRLPRPNHPVFNARAFSRVSKDRFFLCIKGDDPTFILTDARVFLNSLAPLSISEVRDED